MRLVVCRIFACVSLVFLVSLIAFPKHQGHQEEDKLRTSTKHTHHHPGHIHNIKEAVGKIAQNEVMRSRKISLNNDIFEKDTSKLELFSDKSIKLIKTSSSEGKNSQTINALLKAEDGNLGGELFLTVYHGENDAYSGRIVTPEGEVFVISHDKDGNLIVSEVSPEAFPSCGSEHHGGVIVPQINTAAQLSADNDEQSNSNSTTSNDQNASYTVDLLVVYTEAAKSGAGGQDAINALIESAVSSANTSYGNSEVSLNLRLVGSEEVSYNESGTSSTDITRLQGSTDGYMDEVHTLRDNYKADLVALIVNDLSGCGIAFLNSTQTSAFAPYGFSVTKRSCAVGNLSFAHELGHNMGASHDRDNSSGGAQPYSFGHRFGSWRSVMAYAPGVRVTQFSNPEVNYNSEATGVPEAESDSANNAATIRLARASLAGIKTSSFPIAGQATLSGAAIEGVTISYNSSSTNTDSSGNFSIGSIGEGDNYSVSASKIGYIFSPSTLSGTASSNAVSNLEFTASCASGYIELNQECVLEDGQSGQGDNDGDGLTNAEESQIGTDPNQSDSDGDGVSDGQESTDGTNPTDSGSQVQVLSKEVCSEWNGFLGGMYNVLENVNLSNSSLSISTSLYSSEGEKKSEHSYQLAANSQLDILVHDMQGREENQIGQVCTTHSGNAGDVDGRMIYYHSSNSGGFDFAFAMPFSNGLQGSQFVSYNTYQPSLAPGDLSNIVANWIQITNQSSAEQSGTLYFYNLAGSVLKQLDVTIPASARRDYSAHQFGPSQVGLVEWRPNNNDATFQLRNVRYYYDNEIGEDSFTTAFQLEGAKGSGEELVSYLDTRNGSAILEISNTSNQEVQAEYTIYSEQGTSVLSNTITLAPYMSYHLISDQYLNSGLGSATVSSNKENSLIVTAMHYGRDETGSLENLYGIQSKQALGSVLRSSYNSFLSQSCFVYLVNTSSNVSNTSISLAQSTGLNRNSTAELSVEIPAKGSTSINICELVENDTYGVVTVQPDTSGSITGSVLRVGQGNSYKFPTPLR